MKKTLFLLSLSIFFVSCSMITGEEIGRLKINKLSTSEENLFEDETTIDLKKDEEIAFWSEMDIEYSNDIQLLFRLRVYKNDEPYGILEIDPFQKNMTLNEVKTSINNDTEWSFTGKNNTLTIKEDGKYTFKGILKGSKNNTLKINKAELVLKK